MEQRKKTKENSFKTAPHIAYFTYFNHIALSSKIDLRPFLTRSCYNSTEDRRRTSGGIIPYYS